MLDIVGAGLAAAGIPYVRLDGSCSAARRAEMLERFSSAGAGAPRLFLASLKAGGVGM
jgi:SNF2 family DNA or RNA helicase